MEGSKGIKRPKNKPLSSLEKPCQRQPRLTIYKPDTSLNQVSVFQTQPTSLLSMQKEKSRWKQETTNWTCRTAPVGKMFGSPVPQILGMPVLGTNNKDQIASTRTTIAKLPHKPAVKRVGLASS